jgi:hypothetical protein
MRVMSVLVCLNGILAATTAAVGQSRRPPSPYYPHSYYAPAPQGENIFGPSRSGVAPPTAIPPRSHIYVNPPQNGAHTGGTNE